MAKKHESAVRAKQNPETCMWEVRVIKTGELVAEYESAYLAKKSVHAVNANLGKSTERWS